MTPHDRKSRCCCEQILLEVAGTIDRHIQLASQSQGSHKPGPEAVSAAIRTIIARHQKCVPMFSDDI